MMTPPHSCNVQLNIFFAQSELGALGEQLEKVAKQVVNESNFPDHVSVKFYSVSLGCRDGLNVHYSRVVGQFAADLNKVQAKTKLARKFLQPLRAFGNPTTRYLFITEGAAAWVVRDLLSRHDPKLYLQTVGIVFIGIEDQARTDTVSHELPIDDCSDYGYLSKRGSTKRQELTARKSPINFTQNSSLAETFAKIDERFADYMEFLGWGRLMCWRMTAAYATENGSIQFRKMQDIRNDLQRIVNESAHVVEKETETAFESKQSQKPTEEAIIDIKRQQRSILSKLKTTDCTRPFDPHQPLGVSSTFGQEQEKDVPSHKSDFDHNPEQQLVADAVWTSMHWTQKERNGLAPDSWRSEYKELFLLGMDAMRKGRFPQESYDRFKECKAVLKQAGHTPQSLDLELEMNSCLALIYLGQYNEAQDRLRELLERIDGLRKEAKIDSADEGRILAIERETYFRYAVSLMRTGQYSLARRQLEHLAPMDEDHIHVSYHTPFEDIQNQYVLQINAYRMRELIEAYLGSFDKLNSLLLKGQTKKALNRLQKFLEDNYINSVVKTRTISLSDMVTKWKITLLQGDYKTARTNMQANLEELKRYSGEENVLTLEGLLYYAQSLVNTCSHNEAMGICENVRQVTERNLGARHPLWLEASLIRAAAHRAQGSPLTALDGSEKLLKMVSGTASFGVTVDETPIYPLALRCITQIGSLQIYVGDYRKAEDTFRTAWDNLSRQVSTDGNSFSISPIGVQCLSGLAWACCQVGKLEEAERRIAECLHRQIRFYLPQLQLANEWDGSPAKDIIYRRDLIESLRARVIAERTPTDQKTPNQQLHPDLLCTLHILSQIEMKNQQPDWTFINEINSTVLDGFEVRLNSEDEDHEWTMRARLAIGHAQLGQDRASHGGEQYNANRKAHATFESVLERFIPGSRTADAHPLALHARRESIMSDMLARAEDLSEEELRVTRDRLRGVFSLSWRHLSGASPDTLLARLYLLTVEVALDDPDAAVTKEKLLAQLGKADVLEQRLVETLQLLERVVLVYRSIEEYETCGEVVDRMRTYYHKQAIQQGDDELHDAAKSIVKRAELLLEDGNISAKKQDI